MTRVVGMIVLLGLLVGFAGCGIFTKPAPTLAIPVPDALSTLIALTAFEHELIQPLTALCQAKKVDAQTCNTLATGKVVLDQGLQALQAGIANPGTVVDWSKVSAALQFLVSLASTVASSGMLPPVLPVR